MQNYKRICTGLVRGKQVIRRWHLFILFRCNTHFCYLCGSKLPLENPYSHFSLTGSGCFNQVCVTKFFKFLPCNFYPPASKASRGVYWNQAQVFCPPLSVCDSEANKPPIISAACHGIGPKKISSPIGQKSMSQLFFSSAGAR